MKRRLRVEEAITRATRRLIAPGLVVFKQILEDIGKAMGAECLYLVVTPPDQPLDEDFLLRADLNMIVWHRKGPEAEQAWLKSPDLDAALQVLPFSKEQVGARGKSGRIRRLAVAIPSPQDLPYGYLGIEYDRRRLDPAIDSFRVLNTLSDLFSSYFERKSMEQTVRENEGRLRDIVDFHPEPIMVTVEGCIAYLNGAGAALLGVDSPAEVIGYPLHDFFSAELHDWIAAYQKALYGGERPDPQEQEIIRFDGEERIVELCAAPTVFDGARAAHIVLRDLTAIRHSEQRYAAFVKTTAEAIWCIELDRPVSADARPDVQLRQVWEHGRIADCNDVAAALFGGPDAAAFLGRSARVLQAVAPNELVAEFIGSGYKLSGREHFIEVKGHLRYFVLNAVGTVDRGRLRRIWVSCIDVTERIDLERRMVSMLEEQSGQIGRDLHDSVGQILTGVRMLSANLASRYFKETDEGFALAEKIARFAAEASERLCSIHRGLVPRQLDVQGLTEALVDLVETVDGLPDIRCIFVHDGRTDVLEQETKLHLYRIVQEATNNALKHARANTIWVSLRREKEQAILEVRDNGKGFDKKQCGPKSLGLSSMQYRAHIIRAGLEITSRIGSGTVVRCKLPAAPVASA